MLPSEAAGITIPFTNDELWSVGSTHIRAHTKVQPDPDDASAYHFTAIERSSLNNTVAAAPLIAFLQR